MSTATTPIKSKDGNATKDATSDANQMLSEDYGCPQSTWLLTIGMVLPNSPFAESVAISCRDLADKVAVAMSSKMTDEEKKASFKKADEFLARPEKLPVSPECLRTCWKAVLNKCSHQADAFKSTLGKSLDAYEIQNKDMVLETVAYLNNVNFMVVRNMDTVVAGGENASRLKSAINANYWPILIPDESEVRAKVVIGAKIKRIIYVPHEKLIYGNGVNFESGTRAILQSLNYLDECNDCEVIMLPILRHLEYPEISQKFIHWYKEVAATDPRLIGNQEVDEMKLIHWLNATPSNKEGTDHVSANGILQELGTQKLVQYLNLLGHPCKHRVLLQPENAVEPQENRGKPVFSPLSSPSFMKTSNTRGRNANRGNENRANRGNENRANRGKENRGYDRRNSNRGGHSQSGVKRKVDDWLENARDTRETPAIRRRCETEQ